MKPAIFIGSLAVAAAAGAAVALFLFRPMTGPGNGAVVCPGSGACPVESRTPATLWGIAVPRALTQNGRFTLCDGNSNTSGCRSGYVGYAFRMNSGDWRVESCKAGVYPCSSTHDALYCSQKNGQAPNAAGCAARPD